MIELKKVFKDLFNRLDGNLLIQCNKIITLIIKLKELFDKIDEFSIDYIPEYKEIRNQIIEIFKKLLEE